MFSVFGKTNVIFVQMLNICLFLHWTDSYCFKKSYILVADNMHVSAWSTGKMKFLRESVKLTHDKCHKYAFFSLKIIELTMCNERLFSQNKIVFFTFPNHKDIYFCAFCLVFFEILVFMSNSISIQKTLQKNIFFLENCNIIFWCCFFSFFNEIYLKAYCASKNKKNVRKVLAPPGQITTLEKD